MVRQYHTAFGCAESARSGWEMLESTMQIIGNSEEELVLGVP